MSQVIESPVDTTVYDKQRRHYYVRNQRGLYITMDERSLRRVLKHEGLSGDVREGALLSPLDEAIMAIQLERDVAYAGSLAGFSPGVHQVCGQRVLVIDGPRPPLPRPGAAPLLEALLERLFVTREMDQRPFVRGWLKVALEALHSRQIRPGQVLVIAGERNCGKSLFQAIITQLLGGRMAKPYRYMSGATCFNSDLAGCEHLAIEDEVPCIDLRSRRQFGARIKEFTVNDTISCHGKGRQAISLTPFWRMSLTVNHEPENLMILPPLDESLQDKLILLKAASHTQPLPTETLAERKAYWSALEAEMPAFVDGLLNWTIPDELRNERFGVRHYHHPELLAAISDLAPETRLLAIIESVFFQGPILSRWQGTAEQLERILDNSSCGSEVRRLCYWPGALAAYLGRLASQLPERCQRTRSRLKREWTIFPPASGERSESPERTAAAV